MQHRFFHKDDIISQKSHKEKKKHNVKEQIGQLTEVINKSNDLENLLFLDVFTAEEKLSVLNEVVAKIGMSPIVVSTLKFLIEEKGYPYGDNINFQDKQIPSLALSQNWESDFNSLGHHTSNDFPERINFITLYNAFTFVAGATVMWALDLK